MRTQNNGCIVQSIDNVMGETMNYSYDGLNRLATAGPASGGWSQQLTYDGFGNITGTQGAAVTSYNAATNQPGGASYDANGLPQLSPNGASLIWDVENRMVLNGSAIIYYSYDPYGKRVLQQPWNSNTSFDTPSQPYFYGISGQKLATFTCGPGDSGLFSSTATFNLYFAGKLIRSNGVTVATDRLGSVRGNVNGERMSYYPYGQERTSTADGREKFGTYLRDGAGQDYADQRYYNQQGAFWSPDPGGLKTANTAIPFSWNRYAYVYGDPVNYTDRHGREVDDDPGDGGCWVDPDDGTFHCSVTGTGNGDGGGGGGESCDDNPFQAQCDAGPVNPGSDTGVGGKPVSDKDRLRDTIWMQQDFRALKAFNPKAGPCQTDLSRFNLSGSQIHSIASSTKLVDVSSLPAGCQQQFDPGMDMTAVANSNTGATFIVYNANNFWQAASSQMSGTLLHEIIHLASSSFNDQTIASKLGVTITSTNTSAISLKLAKDCF